MEVVNVKSYGAKGDGSHDETKAIQDAIETVQQKKRGDEDV